MTDIIIKIMVELLSVFALATKQVQQGRFSECAITYTLSVAQYATEEFAKKLLLKESDIEAVLRTLDRLTQDEARITVVPFLGVVHGLVGNMKAIMECTQCFHDCPLDFLSIGSIRWQGINGYNSIRLGYVSRVE
jgi:hypothetical protein